MPVADLVPLESIDAFPAPVRAILKQFWITTAEEYLSVLLLPNTLDETNEAALQRMFGLDKARMDALYEAAKRAVPGFAFDAAGDEQEPLGGCLFDEQDLDEPLSFSASEPPPDTLLEGAIWPIEHQGWRNTCVAFTIAAMYRLLAKQPVELSKQYIFWAGKQHENPPDPRGMHPASAFRALVEGGACREVHWPYNPHQIFQQTPFREDVTQGPPPQAALDDAPYQRIIDFKSLHPRDVSAICEAVYQGHAVLIGMPFHRYWTQSFQGKTLGRIRPPINEGEELILGHAMCVVGFRADPDAPGDGYFIVRNSWGLFCGAENEDGPGYCHIPYAMITEFNRVAYYITEIAQPSAAEPTSLAAAPPDTPGKPSGDLAAARALLARIQSDVAEVRRLLDRIEGAGHE